MRLPDIIEKIKYFPDIPRDIFILLSIILISLSAFLSRTYFQYEIERNEELKIVKNGGFFTQNVALNYPQNTQNSALSTESERGMYVGSKSGKTYHLPWCSGAKRILDKNKVWFEDRAEAESAGYTPATNCKGI